MNPLSTTSLDIVGLITARGGSKGIPGKNIKPLCGKPLIAWSIEAAQESVSLRRIIVSTDDDDIGRVARDYGAEVPFRRPAELAEDNSSHISVVLHAIDWLEGNEGRLPGYIMLLQPTSPFREAKDIDAAAALAESTGAENVISVCEAHPHPFVVKQVAKDGSLADFIPSDIGYLRRQALPRALAPNGAIYLNSCRSLRENKNFSPTGTIGYFMEPERSLDVDTPWDFYLANLVMKDRFGLS